MRFLPIGAFLLRHLVAVPLIAAALCLGWIVLYLLLLVVAALTDSGIGGPLALPAGLLLIVVLCATLGWGVFTPACAIGAILGGFFRLPKLMEIPIVWAAACALGSAFYWLFIQFIPTNATPSNSGVLFYSAVCLSIPVGIYWWLIEGPMAVYDLARRLWAHFKRQPRKHDV